MHYTAIDLEDRFILREYVLYSIAHLRDDLGGLGTIS